MNRLARSCAPPLVVAAALLVACPRSAPSPAPAAAASTVPEATSALAGTHAEPSASASSSSSAKDSVPFAETDAASASVAPLPPPKPWSAKCTPCTREVPEAQCTKCGGQWDSGKAGIGHCACPTKNAGQLCTVSTDDCRCELGYSQGESLVGTRCNDKTCTGPAAKKGIPKGHCAPFATSFGCHIQIHEDANAPGWRYVDESCKD